MGVTLLANASMPLHFQDEAFRTSVYLINRLPSAPLHGITLFEALFKVPPQHSTLKVFGCYCFPSIEDFNSHKLQFRSIECTLLGYSLNHKGYNCLDPNGKILISRNVIFNELSFPFANKLSVHSKSSSLKSLPQLQNKNLLSPFNKRIQSDNLPHLPLFLFPLLQSSLPLPLLPHFPLFLFPLLQSSPPYHHMILILCRLQPSLVSTSLKCLLHPKNPIFEAL